MIPGAAAAQRPICLPVSPTEAVQTICKPFSLYSAVRLLSDFTVDQLFKTAPPPFRKEFAEFVQAIAADNLTANPSLQKFLRAMPPLQFSQLDRSSGTLLADSIDEIPVFEERLVFGDARPTVSLRIPRQIAGGYWRGPDVLQIALWENRRPRVRIAPDNLEAIEVELECISIAPDAAILRFAPSTVPPLVIRFVDCLK